MSGDSTACSLSNKRRGSSSLTGQPPLAATLARVSALDEYLSASLGAPPQGGWTGAGELFGPDGALLAHVLARIGVRWGTDDRRIHAAFFVNDYVWRLAGAAIAAYLRERRVPDVSAENVAFRFDEEGAATPPVFLSAPFAALVDDCEARAARAHLLADRRALRDWLRGHIQAHLELAVAALRARSPLAVRAQWALAADACASVFVWAGTKLGDEGAAVAEAEAFLSAPGSQVRARPSFLTLEHAGRTETFLLRASCCLSYKLADHDYCATCPLLPERERVERLRATLAAGEGA